MIPSAPLGTDAAADPIGLGAATGVNPPGNAAARRFRFELAAHPASPARARRLTRARLTGWSVGEDTCDTAALVISELVTNAIVHTASSRVVCELHDHDDTVRIAVRDEGCAPGDPRPAAQRGEAEHGRGLLLVDAVCQAWGAQEHGPGLLVWADLSRQADTPGTPSEPCNDLGWGTRPKPGPADGTGEGDDEGKGDAGELSAAAPAGWEVIPAPDEIHGLTAPQWGPAAAGQQPGLGTTQRTGQQPDPGTTQRHRGPGAAPQQGDPRVSAPGRERGRP